MKKQSRQTARNLSGKLFLARVLRNTEQKIYISIPTGISGVILHSELNGHVPGSATVPYVRNELLVVKYVQVLNGEQVFTPEVGEVGQQIRIGEVIQLRLSGEDDGGFHSKRGSFQLIVPRSQLGGRQVVIGKFVLAQIIEINGKVCKLTLDLKNGLKMIPSLLSQRLSESGTQKLNGFPGTSIFGRPSRKIFSQNFLDDFVELESEPFEQNALICAELGGKVLDGTKTANVQLTVYCLDIDQETSYLFHQNDDSDLDKCKHEFSNQCGINNVLYGITKLRIVQNHIVCKIISPQTNTVYYGFIRNGKERLHQYEKNMDQVVFTISYTDDFSGLFYLTPLSYENQSQYVCLNYYGKKEDIPAIMKELLGKAHLPSSINMDVDDSVFKLGKVISGVTHIMSQLQDRFMCQILTDNDYKRINCYILHSNLKNNNFADMNGLQQSFYILDVLKGDKSDDFLLNISQLPYDPNNYCLGRATEPKVGQVSQGGVIMRTAYTYIVQFLQSVTAKIPIYAANLEVGKVYNFIVANVVNKQIEVIHTKLPCSQMRTQKALLEVFNYKYLQEYNTKLAQFITDQDVQNVIHFTDIVSVHPQGFVVAAKDDTLSGKFFILPKSVCSTQFNEQQVINDIIQHGKHTLQQVQQAHVISRYPPIVSQVNYVSGQLYEKQQLKLITIGCTSSYILFIGPNDLKVRVSCKTQEQIEPYKEYDVIVYEPCAFNGCWNGKSLAWQLPSTNKKSELNEIIENKRSFELMKTENINDCITIKDIFAKNLQYHQTIQDILKIDNSQSRKDNLKQLNESIDNLHPLKAVVLLNITVGPLTGSILDLGSGLLGFICNQIYNIDQELSVVPQSKIILSTQKHFELLQLNVGPNQYLDLITVELFENVKKANMEAQIIQKFEDYAILWIHTGIFAGRHILMHWGDFCQKSYTEFSLKAGSNINLSVDMLYNVRVNKNDFINSTGSLLNDKVAQNTLEVLLVDLLDFQDLLCIRKYNIDAEKPQFVFLNGSQPTKALGNCYETSAINSLTGNNSGILKIDLEELLQFYTDNYDIKPGFYQFQKIEAGNILFRPQHEIDRQPKSAQECQVGQKLHGYITYFDERKVYVQVSRFLAGHMLRFQFEYYGQQTTLKKFKHVTFRVTKQLFKDCVAGVALKHMLSETFCLSSDLQAKQLHICQVKKIADKHIIVELADVWPPCRGSASFNMARRNCDKEQLQELYKPGNFYYCIIVDVKFQDDQQQSPQTKNNEQRFADIALAPEAFIEAGVDFSNLKDLNKRKNISSKQQNREKQQIIEKNNTSLVQIQEQQAQQQIQDSYNTSEQSNSQQENSGEQSEYSYVYESEQEESLDFDQLDKQNDQLRAQNIHQITQDITNQTTQQIQLLGIGDEDGQNNNEQKDNDDSDNVSEQQLEPEDFEHAIQKNKYSSYIFIKYAEYYVRLHQLQEAHKVLERGLETLPLFDSALQNERANLQIARISLIERYDDIEAFYKQGIEILRAFEAPGLLGRRLAEKYLQKAGSARGQEKEKYTGFLERLFASLFKQKKRKRDLQMASLYVRYLFLIGKAKRSELQQITENIEGSSAMIGKIQCLIGSLYYGENDDKLGYQFYLEGNKGIWDLTDVDKWCDDVEKNKNDVAVRDFYVQITKYSFNTKKEMKALQQFLRHFLDFEKQRGGEPGIVQQLTMELLGK